MTIAKSAAPVPVMLMFARFNVAVPEFNSLTVVAAVGTLTVSLPNAILVGFNVTDGELGEVPVPASWMT